MMYAQATGFYPGCQAVTRTNGNIICVWAPCLRLYMNGTTGAFYCPSQPDDLRWNTKFINGATMASATDAGYGYVYKPNTAVQEILLCSTSSSPSSLTIHDFSYGWNDWGTAGAWNGIGYPGEENAIGSDGWGIGLGLGADIDKAGQQNGGRVRINHIKNAAEFIVAADRARVLPLYVNYPWRYNIDPTNQSEAPGNVHNNGSNVLFADGHVVWMSFDNLVNIACPNGGGTTDLYNGTAKDPLAPNKSGPGWQHMRRMWNRIVSAGEN